MDIWYWNDIVYKTKSGDFFKSPSPLLPEELHSEFGIACHPIVKGASYSHIPDKWAEDVRIMLVKLRNEFDGLITITQVKEKYCELVVYWDTNPGCIVDKKAVKKIINDCIITLKSKKIYPITMSDYIRIFNEYKYLVNYYIKEIKENMNGK